jgi:signal transduction histidine kinase
LNLGLLAIYLGWFAYAYRHNPFPREMYPAVAIGTFVTIFAFFFPASPPLIWSVGIPGCFWGALVLLRKSLWTEEELRNQSQHAHTGPAVPWLSRLLYPVTQDGRAYRAFAGWYFYFFLLSVVFTLMIYHILPYTLWEIIVHVQFLTLVTWLVINYLNYSSDPTTFLVKLVGLFLCLTMIILGLVGFLLFRLDTDYRLIQRELRILALLIIGSTAFIITVFPVLFRSNLLQPLQKVVDAIKRVNSGDLRVLVNVPVQDEIGYLAASFNQMTDSLRQYSEEMEGLVAQRTVELQQQQEELLSTLEQLRTAQEQLKRLDVQKTRFFDNITHELRTPLTLILAPAEHLLRAIPPTSPQFLYLQSVERNARQLLRLINQLLYLSRLRISPGSLSKLWRHFARLPGRRVSGSPTKLPPFPGSTCLTEKNGRRLWAICWLMR